MENINRMIAGAIDNYYKVLSKTGHVEDYKVENLIALNAINFMLENFSLYLTHKDMRDIAHALYCISGNCLIDFPVQLSEDSLFHEVDRVVNLRKSEDEIIRISENNIFRVQDVG